MKNNILFLIDTLTQFNELSRVAIILQNENNQAVFVIRSSHKIIEQRCIELNFKYIDYYTININTGKKNFLKKLWTRFLYEIPLILSVFISKKQIRHFQYIYTTDKIKAKYLVQNYQPKILLVAEDGIGSPLVFLKYFNKKSIPIINYPYEYSTIKQLENRALSNEGYEIKKMIEKLLLTIFSKKWIRKIYNKNYTVIPTQEAILYILFRINIPNPWTVHGGISNFLIAESQFMKEHYINEGIDSKKIMLLGNISNDILLQNLNDNNKKKSILLELGLDINKKTILCALIPDYTSTMKCEFHNYEELVDFWIDSINNNHKFNIIYQLHPAVSEIHKKYIKSKNVHLSDRSIVDLIPICDIYITSVSSTIRYATACSKPVINYDMYFMNYSDYQSNEAVITIQTKEDFFKTLYSITENRNFYENLVYTQKEQSKLWGMMDGNVSSRIKTFLESKIL
ncbi:MAG: hypothetical protein MUC49_20670 [Raineya sp.]|jgi:hypothetical protein|nr:hypothetical protein [Raineya sp.]